MNICFMCCIAVVLFLSFIAEGQPQSDTTSSKEFVFAFPINYVGAISIQLYIHTQEPTATFVITTADGGYTFSGSCSPSNPAIVDIPTSYEVRTHEFEWRQKGLKVSSDQDISVVAWSEESQFTYSTALVYPACERVLGVQSYTYYVMSTEPAGFDQGQSQLLIVGCQDRTFFTITPTQNITIPADLQSHSDSLISIAAGTEHRIFFIHSMQTLLISSLFDLSGTIIVSGSPLSVISGSQCANIPSDVSACDFIMTHVPPTHQWGRRFLLSPHKGRFAQGYKILAQADETLVITTCNESAITNYMLNDQQSEVFFTRGDTYCSVESTDVIYMVQLGVGVAYENDNVGDPSLNNIPPIEQHLNTVQFTAHFGDSHYSIVVQDDSLFNRNIILDGIPQTISNWRSIYNFNGDIVGYGFSSEVFTGTHTVAHPNSSGVLSVSVYGWSRFGGYGYTAGSSVQQTNNALRNGGNATMITHDNWLIGLESVLSFFEVSEKASVFSGVDDDTILFNFPTSFCFNDITYNNAYISSNGLVSFGTSFNNFAPLRLPLSGTLNIIAPYWDDIDLGLKGSIFFESYSNDDEDGTLRSVSDFITISQALSQRYNPLSATIIHWSNVCPHNNRSCNNVSTFQAVLTSDDTSSYAIFIYKCGSLNWNHHNAGIGYSAGTEFYKNHILSMKPNVNDIACLNEPHSEWSNVVYRVDGVTNPVCETDCNPSSRHPECCSDDNLGKFLEVENNSFTIRYLVCPVTKPDYCDMI